MVVLVPHSLMTLSIFSCACWLLHIFFREMSIHFLMGPSLCHCAMGISYIFCILATYEMCDFQVLPLYELSSHSLNGVLSWTRFQWQKYLPVLLLCTWSIETLRLVDMTDGCGEWTLGSTVHWFLWVTVSCENETQDRLTDKGLPHLPLAVIRDIVKSDKVIHSSPLPHSTKTQKGPF